MKATYIRPNSHKRIYVLWSLLFLYFMLPLAAVAEPLIITYRAPESKKDTRYDYDNALLKLALEKTVPEYGAYTLRPSKVMNFSRAIRVVEHDTEPNFFIKLSYDYKFSTKMAYVPFPVDLGIVGYRVCFVSPDGQLALNKVTNLTELKALEHGQGRGWGDVDILRHNGFTVKEASSYNSLFLMVVNNRFDLFCRGVNELLGEYDANKGIEDLVYDKSIAFYYPLPRFFYSHFSNTKALERITKGLAIAYKDGSLKKLWLAKYEKSITFSHLENRTIYQLENPLLKNINFDFEQYFYNPVNKVKP